MIKSITHFLIIFFIFQQLNSQISRIDQNGYTSNPFCDETLHLQPLNLHHEQNKNETSSALSNSRYKHAKHSLILFQISKLDSIAQSESYYCQLSQNGPPLSLLSGLQSYVLLYLNFYKLERFSKLRCDWTHWGLCLLTKRIDFRYWSIGTGSVCNKLL